MLTFSILVTRPFLTARKQNAYNMVLVKALMMVNANPIMRAMDWNEVKKRLPNDVSRHLPDGDPMENHKEIQREIERMTAVGPRGRDEIRRFVDGEITADKLDGNLEEIQKHVNEQELQRFRSNLRTIVQKTDRSYWRDLIPLMSSTLPSQRLCEVAKEINKLDVYSEEQKEGKEVCTN